MNIALPLVVSEKQSCKIMVDIEVEYNYCHMSANTHKDDNNIDIPTT